MVQYHGAVPWYSTTVLAWYTVWCTVRYSLLLYHGAVAQVHHGGTMLHSAMLTATRSGPIPRYRSGSLKSDVANEDR